MPKLKPKRGFFIKDILVINDEDRIKSHGEMETHKRHAVILDDGTKDPERAKKIGRQIKLLAKYAKLNHNPHRFTRVITDEFSFYTRATPLTLSEYKYIINATSRDLKSLPPNIILIISSMPVLWTDGTLRNAVLHIQSPNDKGSLPIIHHFSKETVSEVDPYYNNVQYNVNSKRKNVKISPYDFDSDDYSGSRHNPNVVLQNTRAMCFDPHQYKSAILVKGKNLPPIINVTEVCLDHSDRIAWNNAKKLIRKIKSASSLPYYISHFITSNITEDIIDKNLTASLVQADSDYKKVGNTPIKKSQQIKSHFGVSCQIYVYHQRRAEILHSDHFKLFRYKANSFNMPIHTLIDGQNNTLLHQIFLTDKHSKPDPNLLCKRFNQVIKYVNSYRVNQKNDDGNTPLHLAMMAMKEIKILSQLLITGARLDILNNNGKTPLDLICRVNDAELIQDFFVIACHLNPNMPDQNYVELIKYELQHERLNAINFIIILYALRKINDMNMLNRSITPSTLTVAEQLLAQAYISNQFKLLDFIKKKLPFLFQFNTINKIANTFSDKIIAKAWLFEETIKNEFKKTQNADIHLIKSCLPYIMNLDKACGINSLTIQEKLIAQAYISNDPKLLVALHAILLKRITTTTIENIIATLEDKDHARIWLKDQITKINQNAILLHRSTLFPSFTHPNSNSSHSNLSYTKLRM